MKTHVDMVTNTGSDALTNSNADVEYVLIPTVEEAKQFFGPITIEERKWRNEVYFNELLKSPRSKLGIGEHDRAEAYIFGNGNYPVTDANAHQSHFPVSVKVIQIEELFLSCGETLDLTAYPNEFPWDTGDSEIYLQITVKRLVFSNQSKLVVNGNVFILNCEELVANDINDGHATIELGTSNLVQQRSFTRINHIIDIPDHTIKGIDGANGSPLTVEPTPLGLRVVNTNDQCYGHNGTDGYNGLKGDKGRNGAMLYLSDLRFGKLTGFKTNSIWLKAGAGKGFPGSDGTNGGDGGNGGNGANGLTTPFGIVSGFPGGNGGCGGNGGNGGQGGSGGMCCDIFISVPHRESAVFKSLNFPSKGGNGGKGGKGGKKGLAGTSGVFYENKSELQVKNGIDGLDGLTGKAGKTREAPKVHIYEQK